jgi:hypothetical protein
MASPIKTKDWKCPEDGCSLAYYSKKAAQQHTRLIHKRKSKSYTSSIYHSTKKTGKERSEKWRIGIKDKIAG